MCGIGIDSYRDDAGALSDFRCSNDGKLPGPTHGDEGMVTTVCAEGEMQTSVRRVFTHCYFQTLRRVEPNLESH